MSDDFDMAVRLAAFAFLAEKTRQYGDVLPSSVLAGGFSFRDQRVLLMGPKGIFKPACLPEMPISITTAPPNSRGDRPYDDGFVDGALLYRYRGTDPRHPDNQGLRLALERRRPLVYFHGVIKGRYLPLWPAYVVGDEPGSLRFRVEIDDAIHIAKADSIVSDGTTEFRREYITVAARHRLHQSAFRIRVLRAYRQTCALCRLRHSELLDAAHIAPDADPLGEPVVANGVALCKLHHAAFDRDFLGIRPDCIVEIRRDILEETDGPMLLHGLQDFHGQAIWTPSDSRNKPRIELLEMRYERFRESAP
jgi:putative restriction endonuclease